jgi:hypothetical protein
MKVKQIVGEHKKGVRAKIYTKKPQNTIAPAKPKKPEVPVSEDAKITKSDTTGVEITADDGVKTTLPPEKAAALTPDPSNPNEYDLNPNATSPTGDTPTGPKVGANVEIKTTEEITDLGNGAQKKTNPDGTYEIGDGSGLKLYSADGKLIKTISPNFAGFSQETDVATGNVTKRYSSGPMSTSQTTDKTGKPITTKANYDLGVANLDTEQDHVSGIRSNALTAPGMDPNELLPTADIAASRGVDPKKFAAFQQKNPSAVKESPELTAMLKIAGLR